MALHRISASRPTIGAFLEGEAGYTDVAALLDTGASITAVHPRLVPLLRPTPLGTVDITRVGGRKEWRPTYLFTITLRRGKRGFVVEAVAEPPASDCDVLIGRDLLSRWVMTWDGPGDRLLISY